MTTTLEEICSYFSGGFVSENAPCLVHIKSTDLTYNNIVNVKSKDHDKNPDELMEYLSEMISIDKSNIIVEVYSLYGAIDGSKVLSM